MRFVFIGLCMYIKLKVYGEVCFLLGAYLYLVYVFILSCCFILDVNAYP